MIRSFAKAAAGPVARVLTGSSVRMLMYHRFGEGSGRRLSARLFECHLEYLTRHFRVRPLREVVAALKEGRPVGERTAVVTIDDGYADFAEYAYPALVRYEVPATVFVVSRFLDGDLWLWFDAVHYLLTNATTTSRWVRFAGQSLRLDLRSGGARERTWSAVGERLLAMNTADRTAAIARLGAALGVSLPARPTDAYAAMTWDDATRMDRGLIEFGSHTCTHAVLSRCNPEELVYELHESRRMISARLGRAVDTFAYPHGEPSDYDQRTIAAAKAAGYACAAVSYGGAPGRQHDLFQLKRLSAATDLEQFRSTVNGLEGLADKYRAWRHAAAF